MKQILLVHLCFFSAFFLYAQKDIPSVTSMAYLDNYSNLQTYWQNNSSFNHSEGVDPVLIGGFGDYEGGNGVNANPKPPFNTITTLNPIPIGSIDTQHKPQAKTWSYAGKWWCAVPPSSGGTWVFRLDGTTWTPVLRIATSGSRTDTWVVGDLVHILMFKGSGANAIATAQYDPATNAYKVWSARPAVTNVSFPSGVESATLVVDGNNRMWVAADAVNDIRVWWSDSPYTSWSSAITVATGIGSDDISAVTVLQGKIGVFWSNQNTGLFGFKVHNNGDSPTTWSADEVPASQSAIPGNPNMADDHMNLTLSNDGTLYCVAKTSYNNVNLPELILLVRRPAGTWDNLYPVTIGQGSQAIVLVNDVVGKIKVVYTSESNGGQILYKESPVSSISFGASTALMGSPTANYNFSSSTHQTYNPDVAIIATNQGSPRQIVSVLATDGAGDVTPPTVTSILRSSPTQQNTTATSVVYAVNFSESVTGVNAADFALTTGGTAAGNISNVSGSGSAYTVTVNNITGTGSLRLDLNGSGTGIIDGASNPISGGFTSGETYNVSPADVTPPSVTSILRSSPTEQNTTATTVIYAVNFSESVTGVNASDFTLTKGGTADGNISNVSGSGAAYTVTVNNITGTGSLRIDLNGSGTGIIDGASNPISGGFTGGETYNVSPADVTAPFVTSILRSSPTQQNTTATTVVYAVNFSESVTGVDAADFTLTTGGTAAGSISNVAGSGASYTVTVNSITGTGSLRLDLNGSGTGIIDGASNPIAGGFFTGETYNVSPGDVTAPFVTSILRSSPTQQNTTATTVVYAVNFSESVTGVDVSDFTLTKGGTADGNISNVSGSGSAYTVTVNNITGTGSLRLDLNGSSTGIIDGASNAISGGFTSGETYNVSPSDVTPPEVTSILRSSPIQQNTTATTVVYAVNFSESVTGVDAFDLTLTTGGTATGSIIDVSGSGAAYTVTVNNITGTGSLRLDLKASGTGIIDGASNAISGGFTSGETYNVSPSDVTAPSVTGILRYSPTEQSTAATTVVFAVNFSEAVNGVDASDFILNTEGSVNGTIATLLGVCANYTVTVTSITGSGTLRLDLKNSGTGIVDAVGNPITGGFTSGQTYIRDEGSGFRGRSNGKKTADTTAKKENLITVVKDSAIAPIITKTVDAGGQLTTPHSSFSNSATTAPLSKKPSVTSINAIAYPNPFSGEATFSFTLPDNQAYVIKFYDSRGFQIAMFDQGTARANVPKNIKIDGSRLPAGLYMVSIQTSNDIKVLKLVKE